MKKTYTIGCGEMETTVKAEGVFYSSDATAALCFYVRDGDKNRNVAVFAPSKWDYYLEDEA